MEGSLFAHSPTNAQPIKLRIYLARDLIETRTQGTQMQWTWNGRQHPKQYQKSKFVIIKRMFTSGYLFLEHCASFDEKCSSIEAESSLI